MSGIDGDSVGFMIRASADSARLSGCPGGISWF